MLRKSFLGLFCTFSIISATLQAQEKTIQGLVVVDFEDDHPQGVTITNTHSKISVETDISGTFRMNAAVGDTLYFESGFLESRRLPLKPIHFTYNPLVVHMNQEVIQLADIIVRPPLTGDLEKDMASVEKNEEIERVYANLGIDIRTLDIDPKEKEEKILPYLGFPTVINIGALVKSMNGYYRKMNNFRQYEKLENRLLSVKSYFGESYFEDIIGIESHEAREFLLYVYGKEKGVYNLSFTQKDYLTLDQLLRRNAPQFKARLKERSKAVQKN